RGIVLNALAHHVLDLLDCLAQLLRERVGLGRVTLVSLVWLLIVSVVFAHIALEGWPNRELGCHPTIPRSARSRSQGPREVDAQRADRQLEARAQSEDVT